MRVGFTIGCFDLFHEGHKNLLNVALNDCDLLVVGVVTDWLVKMQKGVMPCQSLSQRSESITRYREEVSCVRPSCAHVRVVPVDDLKLPWLTNIIDVAYAGEDQVCRFYEHPSNHFRETKIIPRTPGVSSTMLREAIGGTR